MLVFVWLYYFLNLSYAVQFRTYKANYPKLLDAIIVILIRSENPTIPKDCNLICCKCAACIKPMHRSYITFMYLFYVLFWTVMYFIEIHLWQVNLGTFLNIAPTFLSCCFDNALILYLMVPTGQNRHNHSCWDRISSKPWDSRKRDFASLLACVRAGVHIIL